MMHKKMEKREKNGKKEKKKEKKEEKDEGDGRQVALRIAGVVVAVVLIAR